MNWRKATLSEMKKALAARQVSSVELIQASLAAAHEDQDSIGAFISFREQAAEEAKKSDQRYASGTNRPLEGIPVAVKDNMDIAGEVTTAGSKILENYRAVYTATAVQRLIDAGAIIVGKTNLDEFAMGASTEQSAFHPTRNPWDQKLVPGGSSGGSAAAVSAGHVPVALGSDTGGSVRQPASFCGVVGCKPTYGRVSRYGLIALASSLDQIGVFSRSVADNAAVYQIISGPDKMDATSVSRPVGDVKKILSGDITGLRIGLPEEFFGQGVKPEISAAIKNSADVLEKLGATLVPVSIPHVPQALAVYYIILPAEASSNLARYDGIRYGHVSSKADTLLERYVKTRAEGFGAEVKRRIMIGTYVLSAGYADAYYHQAVRVQKMLREEFHRVLEDVDVLLAPTSPTQPFPVGEKLDDPLAMYMADLLTVPANLTGIPAMSLPAGMVDGLPVGLQLMAKSWDEATMYRVAYAFEQVTTWHNQYPPVS